MQTKNIQEGVRYKIRYRAGTKKQLNNNGWQSIDKRPLVNGYGVCKKRTVGMLKNPHVFLLDNGNECHVTSNGVLAVEDLGPTVADKLKNEIANEIDSDTITALQDKLEIVKIMLEGVGIKPTINGTTLVFSYKDAMTFKVIAAKLLTLVGEI